MDPKKLALALGLPETATEEDILLAAAALKKASDEAAETMGKEADATMEEYKNHVPESSRAILREMLVTNRRATLAVLEGLKKQAGGEPEMRVHNRAAAAVKGTPEEATKAPEDAKVSRRAAQEAAVMEVRNRAGNSMTHTAAFEIASREKPELFAPRA